MTVSGLRAVVMVGGRGVRLRPFTSTIPKPLVPVGGECPILEVLLRQLRHDGFDRVTLSIGHLGHLIRSYVGDGSRLGLEVDYWDDEGAPLGTMGPLVAHAEELPEHTLVLNGDLLCDLDFARLVQAHIDSGTDLTVAACRRTTRIDFGVLEVDGAVLREFREKPSVEYRVNMGVYVVATAGLREFSPGRPLGADDLIRRHLDGGRPVNVYDFDGYWLDIGRPEDYDRANAEFQFLRPHLMRDHESVVIQLSDHSQTVGREPFPDPALRAGVAS